MNENYNNQNHSAAYVKDECYERILEHGTNRFFKEGFGSTTMDEIASDLQISKKTIYKYFESKKCLVEAVADNFTGKAASEIGKVIDSNENAVIKILGLLKFFTKVSNLISDKMIIDMQRKLPFLWKRIDEFRAKMMYRNLTIILNQGKIEGSVKDYPTEIMLTLIISAIRSVVNPDFLINNNFSIQTAFMTSFEILFNGILTEKGKEIFNNYKKEAE